MNERVSDDDLQRLIECRTTCNTLQKTAIALRELKALREQNTKELGYATRFATSVRERCYPEASQWRPLPNMEGLLTQIDNMMCGMERSAGISDGPRLSSEAPDKP